MIGEPLQPGRDWATRREIIDRLDHYTVKELELLYEQDKISLGIVRPKRVMNVLIEPADPEWKPEWQAIFQQHNLFTGAPKKLRKLPYSFYYLFECEDDLEPRKMMIIDWELGVLFLNEARRLGSDEKAAESVRYKYFDQICSHKQDVRFFVGTRWPYNQWMVIGVFYPPVLSESAQSSLF